MCSFTKQKQAYGYQTDTGGGHKVVDELGVWDQPTQTAIYKIEKQHCSTVYATGNYIQYPIINYNGKEHEKEYISRWIFSNELSTHAKLTVLDSFAFANHANALATQTFKF